MSLETFWLHDEIDQLNASYAAPLDEQRFEDWPGFFVEDGHYKVQSRRCMYDSEMVLSSLIYPV